MPSDDVPPLDVDAIRADLRDAGRHLPGLHRVLLAAHCERLLQEVATLRAENAHLRGRLEAAYERVKAQAEIMGRRAEK